MSYIEQNFESKFVTPLSDFVRIPNLSPAFDPTFFTNNNTQKAIDFTLEWAKSLQIKGLNTHVYTEKNIPPLVCITCDGEIARNVLLYGHLDKQPHLTELWHEGLGPVTPVRKGNKLYGRGAADDGFAVFAALLAIKSCQVQQKPLPRLCIALETEEESGSASLLYLLDKVAHVIKTPEICICLDTGVLDYSTLWVMTSLRGIAACNVKVEVLQSGVHSGHGGGLVPESLSVLRVLLDRIEDSKTGIVVEAFQTTVHPSKYDEAKLIGDQRVKEMESKSLTLVPGGRFLSSDPIERYINTVWRPALAVTGAEGFPKIRDAGNVLRPWTELRLALRLPPDADAPTFGKRLKALLEHDPPHGAKVTVSGLVSGSGYLAPKLQPWVQNSLAQASQKFFGNSMGSFGGGGSIPFLNSMQARFPGLQIVALGCNGPDSNAHNPNESIDLPYALKFLHCLEHLLADCGRHAGSKL